MPAVRCAGAAHWLPRSARGKLPVEVANKRGGIGKKRTPRPPDVEIIGLANRHGSVLAASKAYGVAHRTFARWHTEALARIEAEPVTPKTPPPRPKSVDPTDRAAMHAMTLEVLAETAAGSYRDADRINAAKALRDALSLDTLEAEAAAGGGFSPQDAAQLRAVQRMLGALLQQAITGLIARADTDERFARIRDLYRKHAQPKATPEIATELAAALAALGPDLYADVPLMKALTL